MHMQPSEKEGSFLVDISKLGLILIDMNIEIKSNTTIPANCPYAGFVVTKVSKNGWCRGYYPSNVKSGDIKSAMASVRAHWLVGVDTNYTIIPD